MGCDDRTAGGAPIVIGDDWTQTYIGHLVIGVDGTKATNNQELLQHLAFEFNNGFFSQDFKDLFDRLSKGTFSREDFVREVVLQEENTFERTVRQVLANPELFGPLSRGWASSFIDPVTKQLYSAEERAARRSPYDLELYAKQYDELVGQPRNTRTTNNFLAEKIKFAGMTADEALSAAIALGWRNLDEDQKEILRGHGIYGGIPEFGQWLGGPSTGGESGDGGSGNGGSGNGSGPGAVGNPPGDR